MVACRIFYNELTQVIAVVWIDYRDIPFAKQGIRGRPGNEYLSNTNTQNSQTHLCYRYSDSQSQFASHNQHRLGANITINVHFGFVVEEANFVSD
jgi:hypothetical protein